MSKSAADVAMVGIAIGPAAIAGVGFATPFWGMVFALGAGIAGGTISLVSQRYGADQRTELQQSVIASALAVLVVMLPVAVLFFLIPENLIGVLNPDPVPQQYGATYLRIIALGVPFAALNLIGSRTLVGADDAYIPMVLRVGGALANILLNAVLIFGLGLGVVGAALGTVIGNVLVTAGFVVGLWRGRLPWVGEFPIRFQVDRPLINWRIFRDLVEISLPLVSANGSRTAARFPLLFVVGFFGTNVVAAFVIALRVRDLLNTPGWGFSLASSSLVGQELGKGQEKTARAYGREIILFAVVVYLLGATIAFIGATPIARLFVNDAATVPIAVPFIRVAAISVVFWGISGAATGPLRASGDTRWPLYAQLLGRYVVALPVAAAGVLTPLGQWGLYLALIVETVVPAVVIYYRVRTGQWLAVSRAYRPDVPADADD